MVVAQDEPFNTGSGSGGNIVAVRSGSNVKMLKRNLVTTPLTDRWTCQIFAATVVANWLLNSATTSSWTI